MSEVMVTLATPRGRDIETVRVAIGSGEFVADTEIGTVTIKVEPHRDIPCCVVCTTPTPMIFTFEFPQMEWYCQVCGWMCGMFGPVVRAQHQHKSTRKLRVKRAALTAEYETARKLRQASK